MTSFAGRTIWTGDKLEILRGLNSASVDLIYMDPPFNSNRNYAAPVAYHQNKHVLFGQQEGRCNGCRSEFPFRVFGADRSRHPSQQRRPGQHRKPAALVCSLQPGRRVTCRRSTWLPSRAS